MTKTFNKNTNGNKKVSPHQSRAKLQKPEPGNAKGIAGDKAFQYIGLLLVVAVFFILYKQSLRFSLIDWDDYGYIKNNPDIHNFAIGKFFTSFYGGNYHPITCITWAIDYSLGALDGKGYHLTNMLFHATNIVLVYFFVKLLFEKKEMALLTAALFAIHPMHVESVAWISERKDLLYGCFFLLSLIAYLNYIRQDQKKYYAASLSLFTFALLSKSAAVVLPLVLLLIDYFKGRKITIACLAEKVPFFLLSIIFGLIALKSQQTSMDYGFAPHFPLINRFFIACYGLTHYLVSYVFPFKQALLHPYPVHETAALPWYIYASVIPMMLMVVAGIVVKTHRKTILFTLGFFLINLVLVIQLLPVGRAIVADRYVYIPYLGLSMLLGYFLFLTGRRFRLVLYGSGAIWMIILGVQTYSRLPVWKNSLSVFSDVISTHPEDESGWYNRGLVYYYLNDYKAALADYDASLARKPDNAPALYNRSLVKKQFQDYEGVLDDLNKAIALEPGYIDARKNRGIANAIFKDYPGALNDFSVVLKQFPNDTSTLINRGLTWSNLNEKEKACADFQKAAMLGSDRALRFATEMCGQPENPMMVDPASR